MTYTAILRSSRLKLLTGFLFKENFGKRLNHFARLVFPEDIGKRLYPHGYSYGITPRPARALLHDPLAGIPTHDTLSRRPTNFQEA